MRTLDLTFGLLVLLVLVGALMRPARADDALLGYRLDAFACTGTVCRRLPTRSTLTGLYACQSTVASLRARLSDAPPALLRLARATPDLRLACAPVYGPART